MTADGELPEPEFAAAAKQALMCAVSALGDVDVQPICGHGERYLHATVSLESPERKYRLKLVNPFREDGDRVAACCKTANRVHLGLQELAPPLASFMVPEVHSRSAERPCNWYIVEELEAEPLNMASATVRSDLASRLVTLEAETNRFDVPPAHKPPWIESSNRAEYRRRIEVSLRELRARGVSLGELPESALRAFDRLWGSGDLDSGRCFVHGDFSVGNIRYSGGRSWLIDFEHSHLGAPGLDLAHMLVNLEVDGHAEAAEHLRSEYEARRTAATLGTPLPPIDALAIERVVGKWNAMKSDDERRVARIRDLLASYSAVERL